MVDWAWQWSATNETATASAFICPPLTRLARACLWGGHPNRARAAGRNNCLGNPVGEGAIGRLYGGGATRSVGTDMNRMLRRYGLASLLAVVAAAALLFFFVRKVSLEDAVELAERSNAAFAQSVLALVKDDLVAFLQSANMAAVKAGPFTPPRLPAPPA